MNKNKVKETKEGASIKFSIPPFSPLREKFAETWSGNCLYMVKSVAYLFICERVDPSLDCRKGYLPFFSYNIWKRYIKGKVCGSSSSWCCLSNVTAREKIELESLQLFFSRKTIIEYIHKRLRTWYFFLNKKNHSSELIEKLRIFKKCHFSLGQNHSQILFEFSIQYQLILVKFNLQNFNTCKEINKIKKIINK